MVGGQKPRGRGDRALGKDRGSEKENPREEEMKTQRERNRDSETKTQRKGEGYNPKERETATKKWGMESRSGCQAPRERGGQTPRAGGRPEHPRDREPKREQAVPLSLPEMRIPHRGAPPHLPAAQEGRQTKQGEASLSAGELPKVRHPSLSLGPARWQAAWPHVSCQPAGTHRTS